MLTKPMTLAQTISVQTAIRRPRLSTCAEDAATGVAGVAIAEVIVPQAIVAPGVTSRIIPSGGWRSGGGRRDDRGDSSSAAGDACDRERASDCLYAVAEPLEPNTVLFSRAAAAVVGNLDRQIPLGALRPDNDMCCIRGLVRVSDGLRDDVVRGRLRGLVESPRRQLAQRDRDDRPSGDALERICEAEIGQDARADPVRELAHLVDRD